MKRVTIRKKLMIASVTAVVFLGECVNAMGSFFTEDEENAYMYFSNGNYEVVTDAESGTTVEIEAGMDGGEYGSVSFSPDGNYMYYTIKNDVGEKELWRCEYRKLKPGSTANEQYCQFITSDIMLASITTIDKGIVFEDTNYNLCYFDGSTVRSIGQKVNKFLCSEDGEKIVFECGTDPKINKKTQQDVTFDETLILYGVEISDLDNIFVLAEGYLEFFDTTDLDNILFTRESDDEEQPYIYVTGFTNGEKCLGMMAAGMEQPENGTVYYTRGSEEYWEVNQIYMDSRGETEEFAQVKEQFARDKNAEFLKDLFVYKNGQETRIDTLIDSVKYLEHTLMYETMKDLIPIDLAMGEREFQKLKEAKSYYWISDYKNEPVHVIDQYGYCESYVQDPNVQKPNVYMNNTDILIEYRGILARASASDEVNLFDFTYIAPAARIFAMDESTIYYGIKKENNVYYDVYKLTEGNSTCIAKAVEAWFTSFYKDGSIMASSYNNSFVLADKNGTQQEIAKDISNYKRMDESTILYVLDSNLWIWQNGESRLLANNVENRIWCPNALEKAYEHTYIVDIVIDWNHRY